MIADDLASKFGPHGPWHGVLQSALVMSALYAPRTERYSWPEKKPTMEREVVHSHLGDRVRIRLVGGQWVGWDSTAPASVTLVVDDAGMSIYGTRCRLNPNVS